VMIAARAPVVLRPAHVNSFYMSRGPASMTGRALRFGDVRFIPEGCGRVYGVAAVRRRTRDDRRLGSSVLASREVCLDRV
jgi:hypothetical protein